MGPAPTMSARSSGANWHPADGVVADRHRLDEAPSSSETEDGSGWTISAGSVVSSDRPPPGPESPWNASFRQI